ncbi:MAG: DUF2905 domain-containing protein [Bacteroidia bacterium]|nr:DUF2905 domain-containing protein [Bacteroidia bacterium]MDW8015111.1 DUF2905 domain-containing protein [Bacteroidia bacterium]
MTAIGKLLIGAGFFLLLIGALLWIVGETGWSFPRLPGDIVVERGNMKIFIPLGTSLLLSLFLTLAFYLIHRLRS